VCTFLSYAGHPHMVHHTPTACRGHCLTPLHEYAATLTALVVFSCPCPGTM
jgi:hypothetical protein